MKTDATNRVIDHLRRTALRHDGAGLPDAELVAHYVSRRDEVAFEALVRRHGPMVLGVCRRVLRNEADAQDAFQATFLVLVRKAGSIRTAGLIGNWLYGVAHNTALKAKAMNRTRQRKERQAQPVTQREATQEIWQQVQALLDAELSRLPDYYRATIVLCDLEGKTIMEAARHLGCPQGTVATRLARGRALLTKRLVRHGMTLSGGVLTALLSHGAATAAFPPGLVSSTVRAATLFVAGSAATTGSISAAVAALTEGVLKNMLLGKLRIAMAVVIGLALMLALTLPGMLTFAQQKPPKPAASTWQDKPEPKKDATGWRQTHVLEHDHPVNLVACSATWAAASDEGGNLYLWELLAEKKRELMIKGGKNDGDNPSVDRLQFTPDGQQVFGAIDGRRGVFHLDLQDPKKPLYGIKAKDSWHLGVSFDGETWLESYHSNRTLGICGNRWTANLVKEGNITFPAEITHAILSANDKGLAVVTADGNIHFHDRDSLKEIQTIVLAKESVTGIQFSPDGKVLAVGHEAVAKLYDTETGKEIATLLGHKGIVNAVAFSLDGKTVVTGGDDHVARLWDAATGKPLAVLEGHKQAIRSVAFAPSGDLLITGSADKTVRIWKLKQ